MNKCPGSRVAYGFRPHLPGMTERACFSPFFPIISPMKSTRKILFIVYIVFLVSLTINMFTKPKPVAPAPVRIITDAAKYVLPKTPTVSLANNTEAAISVDICADMQLAANGVTQPNSMEGFCRVVEVPAKSTTPLLGHTREDILMFQEALMAGGKSHTLRFMYTSPEKVTSEVTTTINKAGYTRLFFRTFFYNPVYNLFAALILVFPGYSLGFAIVAITILIRLILLVPQQHMLVSQRRMQELQPRLKAIQETHKGDQASIGMKTMELYKQEGVNPFGSLLPIFIQIPILIVLYQVVLNISLPVNLAHLYNIEWLQTFKNIMPDPNFYGMHLEKSGGIVGIVLGLSTGGLQFIQMWLAQRKMKANAPEKKPEPKNDAMPDMQKMQGMMLYIFPAMAAWFAYQFPAGVGLYWLIGTIFMIVQQWVANKQAGSKKVTIKDKKGNILS